VKDDDIEKLVEACSRDHEASDEDACGSQPRFVYCHDIDAVTRRLKLVSKQKDKAQLVDLLQKVIRCKGRNVLTPMPTDYAGALQAFEERYPHVGLSAWGAGTFCIV